MERNNEGSRTWLQVQLPAGQLHCLILVVDILFFAVAVYDIAESKVTSTISTCDSTFVWFGRILDTSTYGKSIGLTCSHVTAAIPTGTGVIATTGLTSKLTPTKMILIPRQALRASPSCRRR